MDRKADLACVNRVRGRPLRALTHVPPHQGSGAGIAIKGDAWVSGWYPAATELTILKKAYTSQKTR